MATITAMAGSRDRLRLELAPPPTMCEHIGAAVSLVLEEKTALGLAAVPDGSGRWNRARERNWWNRPSATPAARAAEKFRIRSSDPRTPWADYQGG